MQIIKKGIFLIILSLVFCGKPETTKNISYRIGLPPQVRYAPLFIAKEKGFFKNRNLNVELIVENDLHRFYKENSLNGICLDYADAILLSAGGQNVQIVYRLGYSVSSDVLIGRKKIKSIKDLKGKTISFDGVNTSSHLFVLKLLEMNGVKEHEYYSYNLSPDSVVEALDSGKIDAGHARGISISKALEKGYKILGDSGDVPDTLTDVIALDKEIVSGFTGDTIQFILAVQESIQFIQASPGESYKIIAKAINHSEEDVRSSLKGFRFLLIEESLQSMNLIEESKQTVSDPSANSNIKFNPEGNTPFAMDNSMSPHKKEKNGSLYIIGEEFIRFFQERGQFYKNPDLKTIIDKSTLEKIKNSK